MAFPDMKESVRSWYNAQAAGYTESIYGDATSKYPGNKIRLKHVLDVLRQANAKRVLDVGCGSGLPLLHMVQAGYDAVGFDFAPRMVTESRRLLSLHNESPDRVSEGDIELADSYPGRNFDAAIALGVFPHVIDEAKSLANIAAVLRTGGLVVVEFRNALFSAFTLNRYSYEYYTQAFLRGPDGLDPESDFGCRVDEYFRRAFQVDVVPEAQGKGAGQHSNRDSYAHLLPRFHNPLELASTFEQAALELRELIFYHFHVAPPIFEEDYREEFRRLSLQMEDKLARDWRGYFLASALLAVAEKKES